MKLYFNMCILDLSNCYTIINEETKEAIIVDPGVITSDIIRQIEEGAHSLCAILVTHKKDICDKGITTLLKIYNPEIFAADTESLFSRRITLLGDGVRTIGGLEVGYYSMPGNSADSMAYKIGRFIFPGNALSAGTTGASSEDKGHIPMHSKRILLNNIYEKILCHADNCILLPSMGPPISVGAQKQLM